LCILPCDKILYITFTHTMCMHISCLTLYVCGQKVRQPLQPLLKNWFISYKNDHHLDFANYPNRLIGNMVETNSNVNWNVSTVMRKGCPQTGSDLSIYIQAANSTPQDCSRLGVKVTVDRLTWLKVSLGFAWLYNWNIIQGGCTSKL
jgi:hypothetical protein